MVIIMANKLKPSTSTSCTTVVPINMTERILHHLTAKEICVLISTVGGVCGGDRGSRRDSGRTVSPAGFGDHWSGLPGTEWRRKCSPIPMLTECSTDLKPLCITWSITLQMYGHRNSKREKERERKRVLK